MRLIVGTILGLCISSSVYARQYIQCAGAGSDNYVINLNGENSTFFHTTGVHIPGEERTLMPLELFEQNETHHLFVAYHEQAKYVLSIANDDIDVAKERLFVKLQSSPGGSIPDRELRCFSAIYDD